MLANNEIIRNMICILEKMNGMLENGYDINSDKILGLNEELEKSIMICMSE